MYNVDAVGGGWCGETGGTTHVVRRSPTSSSSSSRSTRFADVTSSSPTNDDRDADCSVVVGGGGAAVVDELPLAWNHCECDHCETANTPTSVTSSNGGGGAVYRLPPPTSLAVVRQQRKKRSRAAFSHAQAIHSRIVYCSVRAEQIQCRPAFPLLPDVIYSDSKYSRRP